ncbi:MAG: type II toxin-antitoxin system HipA family toxin [Clostridiales bacterium]|nr:type II toxin-antitoxin system HipA family toxin [Clostridiales bacterium]
MNSTAEVFLWGTRIGIIHLEKEVVSYEYDRDFVRSGIEVSPLFMPLSARIYRFPDLAGTAFHGAPGMLADSLPDRFGNAIIDQWLSSQGRSPDSFSVIERLCYTGKRGMGALEYVPAIGPQNNEEEQVDLSEMVRFASDILNDREHMHFSMTDSVPAKQLLKLGTSAGGARAKAIIAWNEATNDVRSGQIRAGDGYGYWLMKFDGVSGNGDHTIEDEPEYTRIEYAYYRMAVEAGIHMSECRIYRENGRNHFMTRRFDRIGDASSKIHMQTLGALAHIDYNVPGLCGYEQAAMYGKRIGLPATDIEQLFRRMVFNVLAVNLDDHVKNMSFLMDRDGKWRLSPAYDVTFSYDASNRWLSAHQMTVNGKRSSITEDDLMTSGTLMDISSSKCKKIIDEVTETVDRWSEFAQDADVRESSAATIGETMKKVRSLS